MDNKLLISPPMRQEGFHKRSSLVKVAGLSNAMVKPDSNNLSSYIPKHLTLEIMVASIMDCLRHSATGHSISEFLTRWGSLLLYTPFDFATIVTRNTLGAFTSLPPFISLVILPLLGCYLAYCALRFCLNEWQNFLDLGRGGTPLTPIGLIKANIKQYFANVNVLEAPHIDPLLEPYRGQLFGLNKRRGQRPIVKGIAPQRQLDQKTPVGTFDKLLQMLRDIAASDDNLKVTTSYLEGHTDALKAVFDDRPHGVLGTDGEWDFEIAHPHRIDGSVHVILHPEDCRTVIDQGWGERHTLTSESWLWKMFYHYIRQKRRPVPYNLMLVYAPRTDAEYRTVQQIVEAAVWFSREKDICDRINLGLLVRTESGNVLSRDVALSSGKWLNGPTGRLITRDRALEQGLYVYSPCRTQLIPTFNEASAAQQPSRANQTTTACCQ